MTPEQIEKEVQQETPEIEAPETGAEETPETLASEEVKPQEEATEEQPEEKRHDQVPLAKYLDEQRRRKELERQIQADRLEREKLTLKQQYIERGWPEQEAALQAQEKIEAKREFEENRRFRMEYEVKDLARADEFYADAETFKDDIISTMREKSVGAEEAYMMLRGKVRIKELQTKQEQRSLVRRREVTQKKVASASAAPVASEWKGLDQDDRKGIAKWNEMFPSDPMTPERWKKVRG